MNSTIDRQGAPSPPGTVAVIFAWDTGHYATLFRNLNDLRLPDGSKQTFWRGRHRHLLLNQAVEDALETQSYWVWFISEEHGFQPDVLESLISKNQAIVAPIVVGNRGPFHPTAWTNVTDGKVEPLLLNQVTGPTTLTEVRGASTDGMLVRRAVFEAMGSSWFKMAGENEPEGIHFCERAAELGFQTYIDTSTRLSTLSDAEIIPVHRGDRWELTVKVREDMSFTQQLKHR